jgi:alginate O-acetyltransferase complex protein AlgI
MVFNSYTFVVFFSLMLLLHNLPLPWKVKKINLLLASYIFYAAWNPPFILLLWLSTVVDFFVGRALYTQQNKIKRHALLVVSLVGNLGMLCFFKYGNFFLENFVALCNVLGFDYHPAQPSIILPAGISFYTFTTLCYTIDMYKRESKPVKSLLDFSLFVTFFPHLVAGPIVRPPQLVPQFESERKTTKQQLLDGLLLLTLGIFMKVTLAITCWLQQPMPYLVHMHLWGRWMPGLVCLHSPARSSLISRVILQPPLALPCAWALYCRKILHTPMPLSVFLIFGAGGILRFHHGCAITCTSRWVVTVKGSFRTYINLMITMLIGGLWHGANWTFVVWGGLHGLFLWIEKALQDSRRKATNLSAEDTVVATASVIPGVKIKENFLKALLTFFLVCITWVFFRSATFGGAWGLLNAMFAGTPGATPLLTSIAIIKVAVVITLMLVFHWTMRKTTVIKTAGKLPWWGVALAWSFMLVMIILSQESGKSFIYFQF